MQLQSSNKMEIKFIETRCVFLFTIIKYNVTYRIWVFNSELYRIFLIVNNIELKIQTQLRLHRKHSFQQCPSIVGFPLLLQREVVHCGATLALATSFGSAIPAVGKYVTFVPTWGWSSRVTYRRIIISYFLSGRDICNISVRPCIRLDARLY
jgi:hypothetical protein